MFPYIVIFIFIYGVEHTGGETVCIEVTAEVSPNILNSTKQKLNTEVCKNDLSVFSLDTRNTIIGPKLQHSNINRKVMFHFWVKIICVLSVSQLQVLTYKQLHLFLYVG